MAQPGPLATDQIRVVDLGDDTVAQLVCLPVAYGTYYRLQVSSRLPLGLHAAAARHLIEAHGEECTTQTCEQAQLWLASGGTAAAAHHA